MPLKLPAILRYPLPFKPIHYKSIIRTVQSEERLSKPPKIFITTQKSRLTIFIFLMGIKIMVYSPVFAFIRIELQEHGHLLSCSSANSSFSEDSTDVSSDTDSNFSLHSNNKKSKKKNNKKHSKKQMNASSTAMILTSQDPSLLMNTTNTVTINTPNANTSNGNGTTNKEKKKTNTIQSYCLSPKMIPIKRNRERVGFLNLGILSDAFLDCSRKYMLYECHYCFFDVHSSLHDTITSLCSSCIPFFFIFMILVWRCRVNSYLFVLLFVDLNNAIEFTIDSGC